MNEIIEILKSINRKIDFENEKTLVSDKLIDSIDVTSIIVELEYKYDIEIGMEYITDENFNSAEGIYNMVREIMGEI